MGKRKVRLSVQRKNHERKRWGWGRLPVRIPIKGGVSVFKVSIPLISLPNSQRTALQTPIQVQPLASSTQSPILHTLLSNTENQSLDVQQANFAGKCLHAIPYNHLINTQCMLCVSDI